MGQTACYAYCLIATWEDNSTHSYFEFKFQTKTNWVKTMHDTCLNMLKEGKNAYFELLSRYSTGVKCFNYLTSRLPLCLLCHLCQNSIHCGFYNSTFLSTYHIWK